MHSAQSTSRAGERGAEFVATLTGVTKTYSEGAGARAVLRNVDLQLARGEFLVLIGRSGSGKTTLLNMLAGVDSPSAGEVRVFGESLTAATETQRTRVRRSRIGLVFQFFNLLPTLSVEENLLLPLELNRKLDATGRRRVLAMLDAVGLADKRATFPDRLSGGEQQRAAIARALVHDPELVLADEPTGNLDDENAAKVLALFTTLLRPARKTLVLVTHSAQTAAIGDRVLELHDGALRPAGAAR
jgi:putative ABC transport system ATP-binding protein